MEFDKILSVIDTINETLAIYRSIVVCKTSTNVYDLISKLKSEQYPCCDSFDNNNTRMLVQKWIDIDEMLCKNEIELDHISVVYVLDTDVLSDVVRVMAPDTTIVVVAT